MHISSPDIRFFLIAAALLSLFLSACQSPHLQTGEKADVIDGNLVRIEHTNVTLAYVDPDADFSRFTAILLTPLGLENVKIDQPSSSIAVPGRHEWALTDTDKQQLRQDFETAMRRQLSEKGGYPMAQAAANNVLKISAMLTRIAPNAPKDDFRSRPTGRNRMYTEGAGKLDVTVTFSDSVTGEVLALAKDTRSGSSLWGINNSVTNAAEVRRVFNSWGLQIRAQLDRIHQTE